MGNLDKLIGEMHADIKWIKFSLNKKASKWTERVLITLMMGTGLWVLNQLLQLIPTVKALIN